MQKSNRAIAAVILSAILTSIIASCGQNDESNDTEKDNVTLINTADTTPAADTSPLYDMEQKDFGGREFRISTSNRYTNEMWVEGENGDICNDAIYNRNKKIEEYFNVKIVPVIAPSDTDNMAQVNEITRNCMAGDDVYDLTAVYTYLAGGPVLEGFYYDWNDIPVVDFSREWWVQSANEAFSVGGHRYVAVGDLSITTLLLSYVVFFNQRTAADYNMPNLYDMVLEGKWTVDQLLSLSKDLYQDVNNDGKADENDIYGFAGDKATGLDNYTVAFDIPLIELGDSGIPKVAVDVDRLQTAVEKVYSLYYESTPYVDGWGKEIQMFANGNIAFCTTWINNAFTDFRSMKDDYGILPYPKLDEAQENYYSNAMDNYSLLSVPKTVTDREFVGTIVEAMTRENHFSVVPAYYDVALSNKYARDEQSVAMLDIIMKGRRYDFSILHGGMLNDYPYLFRNTITSKSTAISSKWAAIENSVIAGLESVVEKYSELGN
ncbi:MAG: hypothetical protein HFE63_08190 [Clostridiales bacterium]|nr:hypothetical protein [Clostridiales bacterium]